MCQGLLPAETVKLPVGGPVSVLAAVDDPDQAYHFISDADEELYGPFHLVPAQMMVSLAGHLPGLSACDLARLVPAGLPAIPST